MFRSTGIDVGTTGTRRVSVPLFFGEPTVGDGGGRRVAGVPSDVLTYRKVHLPPTNRSMCRRVVQEELSYSLPFPLERSAWDFTGRPGSEAWVVVVPQEKLANFKIKTGDQVDLDAEPLGFLRAAHYSGVKSALVIDFGASKTTFCAVLPHQVEWVRVMLRGGKQLTQRLAAENKLNQEEAEELKRRKGCELPLCHQFISELIEEVMLTKPIPYDQILICGGGAAMPGLASLLSSRLGREPETFPLPEPLSPYQHVAAFGAALAGRPGQPRVKLQPGLVEQIGGPSPWLAIGFGAVVLMGLMVADLETRNAALEVKNRELRRAITQSVQPYLAQPENITTDKIVEKLKQTVQKRRSQREQSVKHIADSLARLSVSLRQHKDAELRAITYDESKIKFEGDVASAEEAEKLRTSMGKVFPDLQQSRFRPAPDNRNAYEFEGKLPAP